MHRMPQRNGESVTWGTYQTRLGASGYALTTWRVRVLPPNVWCEMGTGVTCPQVRNHFPSFGQVSNQELNVTNKPLTDQHRAGPPTAQQDFRSSGGSSRRPNQHQTLLFSSKPHFSHIPLLGSFLPPNCCLQHEWTGSLCIFNLCLDMVFLFLWSPRLQTKCLPPVALVFSTNSVWSLDSPGSALTSLGPCKLAFTLTLLFQPNPC